MTNRTCRTTRRACATWIAAAAIAAAAITTATTTSDAAIVSWNQPLGGNWSGLNWTGGVGMSAPTSTDHAAFDLAAAYVVNLSVNPNISGMSVGGSNVTFTGSSFGNTFTNSGGLNVSSGSFNLTGTTPVNWTNANTIFFNANATVNNGNDLSAPGMAVGNGGLATAVFTGPGTTLTTTFVGIGIGNGNTGMLTLANGASASSGATVNLATTNPGNATLNVISGATLSTQGLLLANSAVAGKTAYVDVSGTGSTLTNNGAMNIGAASASVATMAVSAGGAVSTGGGALTVESTGLLDIQAGGSFTITNQPVTIGSGGGTQGKIVVGGSGSSFFQTGNVPVTVGGASGGSTATLQTSGSAIVSTGTGGMTINPAGLVDVAGGTFTLNGNATINGGTLQRAAGGAFDWASSRTMTVQNGGDFLVSGFYSLPISAAVTVTGAGSSLVQSASGNLTIGGGSTLTIGAGATVTTLGAHVADGGAGGGTVNHNGGTHAVGGATNPMLIGVLAGATGTYNLAGGTLTVTNNLPGAAEAIGINGAGNFVQTGGQHTVEGSNGNLVIGYGPTGAGNYSIVNGSLVCGSLDVARDAGAQGTLSVNNGGVVIVIDEFLETGLNPGASGTVNVNPGGYLEAQGIYVGGTSAQPRGTGVVNIAGGNVMTPGETRVWNTPGTALNFSAGTLSTASLNAAGDPARFNWTGGTLYVTGDAGLNLAPGGPTGAALALDDDQDLIVTHTTHIAAGASLAVGDGGTFITGSLGGAGAFSVQGNFAIVGNDNTSTTFTGTITGTGGIGKSGTGTLTVRNSRIDNLSVNAGAVAVMPSGGAASGTSTANFVNFGAGARLDLADNKLIVHFGDVGTFNGASYSGLSGRIAAAYNFGAWDGPGIKTSMPDAQADRGITTIAVATADEVFYAGGTFGGVSVVSGDVLLMYTYAGDLNLDGQVDGADYGIIDNYVQFPGTSGYVNGDINYDGVIDGADYGLIDNTIQLQGEPFPSGTYGAATFAAPPAGVTAVPEPSACLVATLTATLALHRRRRRRRHA